MRQTTHKPAKAIMIQGTMSNAGKSLIVAGLCRIFRQDGFQVAPFKSQNMALNSFVTKEGLEMGRAQVMQCEAAGIEPSVLMNPILLKPTNDLGSQVIVHGESIGTMSAAAYFQYKPKLLPSIQSAYDTLSNQYDIVVLEGAGSPAEINLKQQDIVNMGMAKLAKAPVLLAGDIDRGGVFAALYGTMLLLDEEERAMVKGTLINKFRGDRSILQPGLDMLEELIHTPVIGVIPYMDLDLDEEDSLSSKLSHTSHTPSLLDLAVIRLPRISNFTDFSPLEWVDGVSLRYVSSVSQLGSPDLIFLPGTKNTMGDLIWLRESGLETAIKKHASSGTPIFGICGGYQMMGSVLQDPHGVEGGGTLAGMDLLPFSTTFFPEKTRRQVRGTFQTVTGILAPLSQIPWEGYEIHMGQSPENSGSPMTQSETGLVNGICSGNRYGTYVHGIFDQEAVTQVFLTALLQAKGLSWQSVSAQDAKSYKETQYDQLAKIMREHLDMTQIYRILEEGI